MTPKSHAEIREKGYTKIPIGELPAWTGLRGEIFDLASRRTGRALSDLERLHEILSVEALNEFRLAAISLLNSHAAYRDQLFETVRPWLEAFLGPDLAAQKQMGLVISVPGDRTSQIPLHSDGWTGHSPFELNLWVPWTRVFGTQSMFVLPLDRWRKNREAWDARTGTVQELFRRFESEFDFLEMQPGEALLFWHHLPHGNVVNRETSTRWALNVRFKNLFSPYGEKGLGDYFAAWRYSALTEIVLKEKNLWA